jgi:hypothetical protein
LRSPPPQPPQPPLVSWVPVPVRVAVLLLSARLRRSLGRGRTLFTRTGWPHFARPLPPPPPLPLPLLLLLQRQVFPPLLGRVLT